MPSTTTTSVRAGIDAVMTLIRDETARRDLQVLAEVDVAGHLGEQQLAGHDGHRLLAVGSASVIAHALVADPFSPAWLPRWVSVRRVADVVRIDVFGPTAQPGQDETDADRHEVSARLTELLDEVNRRLAA